MGDNPAKMDDDATLGRRQYIWFFTGPTASGKSTIASCLAETLGMTFVEGDNDQTKANVDKMSRGIPLTDEDRREWLTALAAECRSHLGEGRPNIAATCSALRRDYRDFLRKALGTGGPEAVVPTAVRFVFLHASEEVLFERAASRRGHFAGSNLVHSQVQVLELPGKDEGDVFWVEVGRPLQEIKDEVVAIVRAKTL